MNTAEAHKRLKGTFSKDKHNILFDEFKMNYNDEPDVFKRGSILLHEYNSTETLDDKPNSPKSLDEKQKKVKKKRD